MATASVNMNSGLLEIDGNAIRQREILSRCFSEARQRLDERERELSLQLEQKLRENQIHKKKLDTDRLQLKSVSEHIQSNLSSNSLLDTGSEAISVFEQKIHKLREEEKRVQFNWSPQKLYSEISKIGEVSLLPAFPQDDTDYNNCKRIKLESVPEPSIQAQKKEIRPLLLYPKYLKGGEWYLIDISWFNKWKRYVSFDNCWPVSSADSALKPGQIDNTALLENGILKRGLKETDYKLIPTLVWNKLLAWYGITEDSVEIKRKVVRKSLLLSGYEVEINYLEIKVYMYPYNGCLQSILISRCDTILTLDRKVRELYNIGPERQILMRLNYELILDMGREVQEVGLWEGCQVELEVQNVNGTWPRTGLRELSFKSSFVDKIYCTTGRIQYKRQSKSKVYNQNSF